MKLKKNKDNDVEILIVEDSPTQAEKLQYLLEGHGYTVVTARDGKQALAAAQRRKPALIVSDVMMPVMDGFALCGEIKRDDRLKDVPVILLTTLSDVRDIMQGLECGADNFIRKPYEEQYLLARVDYLLMNSELRKNQKMRMGVEIYLSGQKYFITAERQQIVDLLISVYEEAVHIGEELKARQRELTHSNQSLSGLYRVAQGLNRAVSEREVCEQALEHALELPGVQAGWISLWEDGAFHTEAVRNLPPALLGAGAMEGLCECRRQFLAGDMDHVTSILECERLAKAQGDTQGLRYHASVPLWIGDRAQGIMNLVGTEQGLFRDDELETLYGVGHQVGVALERARLHEHLEKLVEQRTAALTAEIAQRKEQEAKVLRLNRIYSVLSGINTTIVRVRQPQELFTEACRIAVEHGQFKMAWIGLLDSEGVNVTPVVKAGFEDGYLDHISLSLRDDDVDGCKLVARVLREKTSVVCNDIGTDPQIARWRAEALSRGYRSVAVFPLLTGGKTAGVFALYAPETGFFDAEEMKLLTEMAGDISFALEYIEKEARLNHLAYYDVLTDLPNRTLFHERLGQALVQANRHRRRVGIALLDLDRFKQINDSLGHGVGDLFLKAVAERLARCVRDGDTVARLAGDEFAVILADMRHEDDAAYAAQKILDSFAQPFHVAGHEFFTSASLGVTLYPLDDHSIEGLLRNADTAMYRAKEAGGNSYQFYAANMTSLAHGRLALENDLCRALERNEFLLYYQPVVSLTGGHIVGMEALIRWQHPQRGLVPPGDFIPITEEMGLIQRLGEWVLRTACEQCQARRGAGQTALRVAVNVSPRQFQQPDFPDRVAAILAQTGFDPALLDLEITESLLMQNVEATLKAMRKLSVLGVQFSIDDFGTGYSSLSLIARLPVDTLKIDRTFVKNMTGNTDDLNIVSTIISLAHSLKLDVIAEGVETTDQAKLLRVLKCNKIQGDLFSPAVPVWQIDQFPQENKSPWV